MKRAVAMALLIWSIAALTAAAQTPDNYAGFGLSSQASNPVIQSFDPPQTEHLLGDWGCIRPGLEGRGIYLQPGAVAEFSGNTGGVQQGATSANEIAFSADTDWQHLAALTTGFRTQPASNQGPPG